MLPIVKDKETNNSVGRLLTTTLYDTEFINTGTAPATVPFYANQLGQPAAVASLCANKTLAETNLRSSGQVPKGFKAAVKCLYWKFWNNTAGSRLTLADVDQLVCTSWFEFKISQITILERNTMDVPGGTSLQQEGNTTADTKLQINPGVGHVSNAIDLGVWNSQTKQKEYPTIDGTESFSLTLNLKNTTVFAASIRIMVSLGVSWVQPL